MNRVLYLTITAALALAGGADALAAATATGTASVTIERAASIDFVSPLVLPTVTATAITPATSGGAVGSAIGATGSSSGTTNSSGNAAAPTGNATLTIHGQAGDAVSMAVPETFKVVRTGGTEALTVKTSTNMEYDAGNGVVLGGSLNADTMSVNVGGALSLASADQLVPGPYEGLLVVVVQYN
jgi:hypothetical protein